MSNYLKGFLSGYGPRQNVWDRKLFGVLLNQKEVVQHGVILIVPDRKAGRKEL